MEIDDPVIFHRAARSLQAPLGPLTEALALQAAEVLELREETTWAEITTPRNYIALFELISQQTGWPCADARGSSIPCEIQRALAESPEVYPPVTEPAGVHARTYGHDFSGSAFAASRVTAVTIDGSTATYQSNRGGPVVELQATALGDGTWLLARSDGEPIETYIEAGIHEVEVLAVQLLLNRGVGGLTEMRLISDERLTDLQNPNQPPVDRRLRDYQPVLSAANPLGSNDGIVPGMLEQKRWVLAVPRNVGSPPGAVLDAHAIAKGGGTTERLGETFAVDYVSAGQISITYDDAMVHVKLLNQDYPGFWRAQYRVDRSGTTDDVVLHGVAIAIDPEKATWSAPSLPGNYVNWESCDGPWGEAEAGTKTCVYRRASPYRFRADGTGDLYEGDLGEVTWAFDWVIDPQLGADTLTLSTSDGSAFPTQGWELVGSHEGTRWVLPGEKLGPTQLAPSEWLYMLSPSPIPF